ncbi:hypothetical protein HNE05_07965 [Aquipseudomonas campi]|uniref:Uncharacterized protein n=1 Tax=Aquipseudomonas campi TaxID=2731681 RepID=A0A6M8FH69_9GAMM|nr:hypothetical protein [Pseudomonas campi]QKE63299.1 hypothetical protein HNE05_07965 [Pseudomonas campi]
MTNPYQTPESAFEAAPKSSNDLAAVIQLIVGLVCALIAALVPALVIPQFQQVFNGFGAQVPLITHIALSYHLWLWTLPIFVIAARIFWPKTQRRPLASCLLGVISLVIVIPAMILAMYLPIFQLGRIT